MIDLENMSERTTKTIRLFGDDVRATQTAGQVFELITLLREAEKDAARYRWLRDCCTSTQFEELALSCSDELDEDIDRAMQCKSN